MSNIRERAGKYQARVTVDGVTVNKTFTARADAVRWERHQRTAMENGTYVPKETMVQPTLADAVDRYVRELLPAKRGKAQEKYLLA